MLVGDAFAGAITLIVKQPASTDPDADCMQLGPNHVAGKEPPVNVGAATGSCSQNVWKLNIPLFLGHVKKLRQIVSGKLRMESPTKN